MRMALVGVAHESGAGMRTTHAGARMAEAQVRGESARAVAGAGRERRRRRGAGGARHGRRPGAEAQARGGRAEAQAQTRAGRRRRAPVRYRRGVHVTTVGLGGFFDDEDAAAAAAAVAAAADPPYEEFRPPAWLQAPDDEWQDTAVYGVLRREWAARR